MLRSGMALWYVSIFGAAIVALVRRRGVLYKSPAVHGLTLCLAFTAVHTLYWSNIRMRAPLMPVVYVVAAMVLPVTTKRLVR